jgi:hypothetical protein
MGITAAARLTYSTMDWLTSTTYLVMDRLAICTTNIINYKPTIYSNPAMVWLILYFTNIIIMN